MRGTPHPVLGTVLFPGLVFLITACGTPPPGADEGPPPEGPSLAIAEAEVDFGEVVQGATVEHTFQIRNRGLAPLEIEGLRAEETFTVQEVQPETIPPQGEGTVRLAFSTAGMAGTGTLRAFLDTNDPDRPETQLSFTGTIQRLIEIQPRNRLYFFDLLKGQSAEGFVELVNHQETPLRIAGVSTAGGPFTVRVETVEDGQRYRLHFALETAAESGRIDQLFTVATDSEALPEIPIFVGAVVEERITTQPRSIDFGALMAEKDLSRDVKTERRVRVFSPDETSFQVTDATTTVAAITVENIEVEEAGQDFVIYLKIGKAAPPGSLAGELVIRTDHPDFPELRLPILGQVL